MKTVNKRSLKRKLDTLVSKVVRLRDKACVTCGEVTDYDQAGHFITRSRYGTRYDLRNVHRQCTYCNLALKGNMIEYYKFMLKMYGQETIDELDRISKKPALFTIEDYRKMIEDTETKLKELQDDTTAPY